MKRCLHIALLSIESAILAWLLAYFCAMQFPDGLIRSQKPWQLSFAFRNSVDRETVTDVQVFHKTRSKSKWVVNERYGRPIFMANAPVILSYDLPRTMTYFRIDFHVKKDIPLPDKVPALDKMEIAGSGMTCSALKEFFSEQHHTIGYEGRLPMSCVYFLPEFWLLFGVIFALIGGGALFVVFLDWLNFLRRKEIPAGTLSPCRVASSLGAQQ